MTDGWEGGPPPSRFGKNKRAGRMSHPDEIKKIPPPPRNIPVRDMSDDNKFTDVTLV